MKQQTEKITRPKYKSFKMTARDRRRYKRQLHHLHLDELGWQKKWKNWRYKNTTWLIISIFAFLFLATTPFVNNLIQSLGTTGYIGAFITGIFFVSVFTAVPASVVLFKLAENLHPFEVALLAGVGAAVGDYAIFKYMKDKIFVELAPLMHRVTTHRLAKLFYTPYLLWLKALVGAALIASPFPDEVGVSILSLSKIKRWQFLLITLFLNTVGIFLVLLIEASS
ncbi:MAG TPA: hypothetical protein VJJ78_01990 [Candidatus Saccharimonadales bacterium]|nr:hypothetical protein [Candidatus Saccharimonadales bacterium]